MTEVRTLEIRFGSFELDEANARLTCDGRAVALPPKAFGVLCELARRPGHLVTKEALLDAVWGHQHVSESTLKTTVSELRSALADKAKQPRYVETASRRGYRFIGDVRNGDTVQRTAVVTTMEPATAPFMPEPPASAPMIGRQAALARLRAAWQAAARGVPQFIWIAGEAGVGKSTLVDAFIAALGPALSARGQCIEQFGAGEPYLPVLEALASACRRDERLTSIVRSVAPTWLVQLPWLIGESERNALKRELAGSNQDRMLRELGELLDRYSLEQPLLLVIEDLHWGDHATIRLIDHLARRRTTARVMWVGTFRLAELIVDNHPLNGLRHELRAHRLCDEIILDPFSERELAEYIERRFPEVDLPGSFVLSLHAHTDGLPLFVVNVIDDMLAQRKLEAGAPEVPAVQITETIWKVPGTLAGMIENRIARLSVDAQAILEAASVCGTEFWPEIVADALGRDAAWVMDICDELVRQQHWLRYLPVEEPADDALDSRYRFRHALYRHVFYQRMGPHRQSPLHRRIAEAMVRRHAEGIDVKAAELALHFELGRSAMAALKHYVEAADSALSRFAPTEAARLSEHALTLLPRCPVGNTRLELELALVTRYGVACQQVVDIAAPEVTNAFKRAQVLCEALPMAPERAWAMSGLGWALHAHGEYRQSLELAGRIHAVAVAHDDATLFACACNLFLSSHAYQGDLLSAKRWFEQGLVACEQLGDRVADARFFIDPIVAMRAQICLPLLLLGLPDEARAQSDLAVARALELKRPMALLSAHWHAARLNVVLDLPRQVQQRADAIQRLASEPGLAVAEAPARWFRGWALARTGEVLAGHHEIVEGLAGFTRLGDVVGSSQLHGFAAEAMMTAGDWAAARQHVADGLVLAERIGERLFIPALGLLQAQADLGEVRMDSAVSSMRGALAEAQEQHARWSQLAALTGLCELGAASAGEWLAMEAALTHIHGGRETPLVARAAALMASRRH